jgi:hypothetical protein
MKSRRIRDAEYIKRLGFEDSDFFTLDEHWFLGNNAGPMTARSAAQLDRDRNELVGQLEYHTKVMKSHEILLKPLEFWELRWEDKREERYEAHCREWKNSEIWAARKYGNDWPAIDDDEGFFEI